MDEENEVGDDLPVVQSARMTAAGLVIIQRSKVSLDESVLIIDVASLDLTRRRSRVPAAAKKVPPSIAEQVNVPLGLLSESRLAFLDEDLWVCTYALDDDVVRRHYFIPRDWASTESFRQCRMLEDSTLLCPKGNEVAVIMSVLDDS